MLVDPPYNLDFKLFFALFYTFYDLKVRKKLLKEQFNEVLLHLTEL